MQDSSPVILLVDDSRLARAAMAQILMEEGFTNLLEASSAREALGILGINSGGPNASSTEVDLILMDVVMPDMDGIEACHHIKAHPISREIPIIMVTAQSDPRSLGQAFQAGVMDYIKKPIIPIELVARINSAITLKQEIDRRRAREQELLDLTARLQAANRELTRISSLDGLTGVANRRLLDHTLEQEWRRANRDGHPISLVMLDIDFFKKYNDFYGHIKGDECLKRVAAALQSRIKRAGDLVARYGGEEFAVVTPSTDLQGSLNLAEEIRTAVEQLALPHEASSMAPIVTVSLGVATMYPDQGGTLADLLSNADKALYKAKENGRNRVESA